MPKAQRGLTRLQSLQLRLGEKGLHRKPSRRGEESNASSAPVASMPSP